jgi:hypothetical protein
MTAQQRVLAWHRLAEELVPCVKAETGASYEALVHTCLLEEATSSQGSAASGQQFAFGAVPCMPAYGPSP